MRKPCGLCRGLVPALVSLSLLLAWDAARAEPAPEARLYASVDAIKEASDLGFAGTLARDGERIAFESRVTPGGAVSRIYSSSGEVLTELVVDETNGIFEYRAGGIALTGDDSAEKTEAALRTFDSDEAALASEQLWPALLKKGYEPESPAMAALAANLAGYALVPRERLHSKNKEGCFGCCGPSCLGCTGCYTSACLAHDLCVIQYGYLDSRCNRILYFAALSAWCCRGVHLGSLC
jgi:hypothetical protein